MALNKSRTPKYNISFDNFLPEEKYFFEDLLSILNKARKNILENILNEKLPEYSRRKQKSDKEIIVRFTKNVEQFVGPELEVYGPFQEHEIARIPLVVARILIEKGSAEEIEEEQ